MCRGMLLLELGKDFAGKFLEITSKHKWPSFPETMNSYGPRIRREEMLKILDKVASEMKLEWKEEDRLRIARAYYKGEADYPIVAVKQESTGKRDGESEIRRLLVVNARLRVLICHPPEKEQFVLRRRIMGMLNSEMKAGRFTDEFLLILVKAYSYPRAREMFSIYSYSPGIFEKKLHGSPLQE